MSKKPTTKSKQKLVKRQSNELVSSFYFHAENFVWELAAYGRCGRGLLEKALVLGSLTSQPLPSISQVVTGVYSFRY
jgi:hypothetical protein